MNKKQRIKKDLAEAQQEFKARPTTREYCPDPNCRQYFGNSSLARESHMSRYPSHFQNKPLVVSVKKEAVLTENLEGVVHEKVTEK